MPHPADLDRRSFKDLLSRVPKDVDRDLRDGFSWIGDLTKEQLETLVDLALTTIDEPHAIDEPNTRARLGLDEVRANAVAAVMIVLRSTPVARESTEEILSLLKERLSLDAAQTNGARSFIVEFGKRAREVSTALQTRTLASTLLPSFEHLQWTVDLRLKFTAEDVSAFAAVAIASLSTDAAPPLGRFWFQMSKSELKRLIAEAKQTLEEMERIEHWAATRVK